MLELTYSLDFGYGRGVSAFSSRPLIFLPILLQIIYILNGDQSSLSSKALVEREKFQVQILATLEHYSAITVSHV